MSEFRRRILASLGPSIKPTTLRGRGKLSWQGAFSADLPRVVVYGEGKQEGTPTPEKPIEPQFLEGASITDGKNIASIPNLLAAEGERGNVIIADDCDLISGMTTRRIGVQVFTGDEDGWYQFGKIPACRHWCDLLDKPNQPNCPTWSCCNYYTEGSCAKTPDDADGYSYERYYAKDGPNWIVFSTDIQIADWKNKLRELYKSGKPLTVWYELENPIIEHYDPTVLRQHPGTCQLLQQGGFREAEIEADVYERESNGIKSRG